MVDAFFDAIGEREGLMSSSDDDDNFSSVHNGADPDGQSHFGDLRDVVVEETRIGDDGIISLLSVCISGLGRTRVLIRVRELKLLPGSLKAMCPSGPIPDINEEPMNVFRTTEKEFNTANFTNFLLVLGALFLKILCIAIQNMDILRINVNMGEQMFVHKCVVRLLMIPSD